MKRIYLLLFSAACLLLGSCTSYQTGASYKRYGSGYNTRYGYSDPWEVGYVDTYYRSYYGPYSDPWEVGSVSPYYRPYRPYQSSFFGFGSYHGHHHHQARHEDHQRSSSGGSKDKRPPVSTLRERGSASSHSSGPDKNSGQSRLPSRNSSKASRTGGGSTLQERGSGSSRSSGSSGSSSKGKGSSLRSRG